MQAIYISPLEVIISYNLFIWVLRFGGSTHETSSLGMKQSHWLSICAEIWREYQLNLNSQRKAIEDRAMMTLFFKR